MLAPICTQMVQLYWQDTAQKHMLLMLSSNYAALFKCTSAMRCRANSTCACFKAVHVPKGYHHADAACKCISHS
jgi:hypothetical protein